MKDKFEDFRYPSDRLYWVSHSPNHYWLVQEEDGSAKVGLTHFFGSRIGKIHSVTLKAHEGKKCERGKSLGIVKAENYSVILHYPLSGEVAAVADVAKHPTLINDSPYDEGWLLKISPDPPLDLQLENWVHPTEDQEKLRSFVEQEVKNKALLEDDCCPDLLKGSKVVRRRRRKTT